MFLELLVIKAKIHCRVIRRDWRFENHVIIIEFPELNTGHGYSGSPRVEHGTCDIDQQPPASTTQDQVPGKRATKRKRHNEEENRDTRNRRERRAPRDRKDRRERGDEAKDKTIKQPNNKRSTRERKSKCLQNGKRPART